MHRPSKPTSSILKPSNFNRVLQLFRSKIKQELKLITYLINSLSFKESFQKNLLRYIDRIHIFTLTTQTFPIFTILPTGSHTSMEGFPTTCALPGFSQRVLITYTVQFAAAITHHKGILIDSIVTRSCKILNLVFGFGWGWSGLHLLIIRVGIFILYVNMYYGGFY